MDRTLAARRREEILAAAIGQFASTGFAGTDLESIAAELGCAKGTLYRYFPSKATLFRDAVDEIMRKLVEQLSAPAGVDPLEQLENGVRAFLSYFHANPTYVEMLIQERAQFRDRQRPTYYRYRDASRPEWERWLRAMMKDGRLRKVPPARVLDVLGDLMYGTIFVNYFACRKKTLQQQAEDVLDVLLNGLLTLQEKARRSANAGG